MSKGDSLDIKALAFDTGGTIFNWHDRLVSAFEKIASPYNAKLDWHEVANDWRHRSLMSVLGKERPDGSMDEVHRRTLDETLFMYELADITAGEREQILGAWYDLDAWPDFAAAMRDIRAEYPVISLTLLPLSLVLHNSRRNGLTWDAIISCEMTGIYKPHPQAYLNAATWLNLKPSEILMVACHNIDLNAARKLGLRTAFVHRPAEWGPVHRPDAGPNMEYDFVVDGFDQLATALLSNK